MSDYKVGDKFEIEIAEAYKSDCPWSDAIDLYRIKGFNSLVFDKNGLDKLKKIEEKQPRPKTVKASELPADTVVLCWNFAPNVSQRQHFAGLMNGKLYSFVWGLTSEETTSVCCFEHMTLEDGTVVLAE